MSICFLITTYGRRESCQRLVDSLEGLGSIVVLNDGADYDITGAIQYKHPFNFGKRGYWLTVNNLFRKRIPSDYYFMIPDDFLPKERMIERAVALYTGIEDKKKVCLNLYADRVGKKCWTGFKPVDRGKVYLTQWVDMCFVCTEEFFSLLGTIPKIDYNWFSKPNVGSGVGAYVSKCLLRRGGSMYQVKESLVEMQEEHLISQMHNANSGNSYPQGARRKF